MKCQICFLIKLEKKKKKKKNNKKKQQQQKKQQQYLNMSSAENFTQSAKR